MQRRRVARWILIAVVAPIALFAANRFFGSFLEEAGKKVYSLIAQEKTEIFIRACAPLRDARFLLKQRTSTGDRILDDKPLETMNPTSVFVQNKTTSTLKNVVITIYPLGVREPKPDLLYSYLLASSIAGSAMYEVTRQDGSLSIRVPILNPNDLVIADSNFAVPIGYIIEVFSDSVSAKMGFEPGCKDNYKLKMLQPVRFYEYVGPRCSKRSEGGFVCEMKDVPFTITEQNRDGLYIEQLVIME